MRVFADINTPDARNRTVTRILERIMRGTQLETVEILACMKVDHATHGIRAVDGCRTFFQDVNAFDCDLRDGVHVHEATAHQTRRDVDLSAAVDQHQRARSAQPAQVHVGNRLGQILAGAVPTAVFADDAVTRAQVLEQVDHRRRALKIQHVSIHRDHLHGGIIGILLDETPRDGNFFRLAASFRILGISRICGDSTKQDPRNQREPVKDEVRFAVKLAYFGVG